MPHPTSVDARPKRYLPLAAALSALLTGGGVLHGTAAAQVLVENSLKSAWAATAEWTLEEDLRISGPPGGYLGMVVAVAADSRDNIYILEYVTQEIHVFDPEGELPADARRTGRRSRGVPRRTWARHRAG